MPHRPLVVALASALLVGCASWPSPRRVPARLLPTPAAPLTGVEPDRKVTPEVAQNPSVPSEGPVTLEALLEYADVHAPALAVARAKMARGEAAIEGAEPLLPDNPQLTAAVGPRLRADGTGVDFQMSLMQRVEIAGERGLRREAAEMTQQRIAAELDAVRWQTHWQIHAAYHQARVARERAKMAAKIQAFQLRLLEIALERKKAGDISGLPVRIAEGEAAQARVQRIAALQSYRALRFRLARLSGWPPENPPEPAGALSPPRKAPPLEEILRLATRNQPRLKVLEKVIAAAEAEARSADRDGFPEPSIGAQVNRESEPTGAAYAVLGKLQIPLPLFRRNQKQRAAADAEVTVARAESEAFERRLASDLALAKSEVDTAAERLGIYGGEILPIFEQNIEMLQRAYEVGEIDMLAVSLARERFLAIQNDALEAYDDYFAAVATLEALVGVDLWADGDCGTGDRSKPSRGR